MALRVTSPTAQDIKYEYLWPTRDYGWYSSSRVVQVYPAADAFSYSFLTSDTGTGTGSDSGSFSSIVADVIVSVLGDVESASFGNSGLGTSVESGEVVSLSALWADVIVGVSGDAASGSVLGTVTGLTVAEFNVDAEAVSHSTASATADVVSAPNVVDFTVFATQHWQSTSVATASVALTPTAFEVSVTGTANSRSVTQFASSSSIAPIPPPGSEVLVFNTGTTAAAAWTGLVAKLPRPLRTDDLILVWAVVQSTNTTSSNVAPLPAVVPTAAGSVPAFTVRANGAGPTHSSMTTANPPSAASRIGRSVLFAHAFATSGPATTIGAWTGATTVTVGVIDGALQTNPVGFWREEVAIQWSIAVPAFPGWPTGSPSLTKPDGTSTVLRVHIAGTMNNQTLGIQPAHPSSNPNDPSEIASTLERVNQFGVGSTPTTGVYTHPAPTATIGAGSVEVTKQRISLKPTALFYVYALNNFGTSTAINTHFRATIVEICGRGLPAQEQETLLSTPGTRDIPIPTWAKSIDLGVLGGGGGGQSGNIALLGYGGLGAVWRYEQNSLQSQGFGKSISVADVRAAAVSQGLVPADTADAQKFDLLIRTTVGAGGFAGQRPVNDFGLINQFPGGVGGQSQVQFYAKTLAGATVGPIRPATYTYTSAGGLAGNGTPFIPAPLTTINWGQAVTGGQGNGSNINFLARQWSGGTAADGTGKAPGGGAAGGGNASNGNRGGDGCVNIRFNSVMLREDGTADSEADEPEIAYPAEIELSESSLDETVEATELEESSES